MSVKEFYSQKKEKIKPLIPSKTWMNLKGILLSERISLKRIHTASFHLYDISKRQDYRTDQWCLGLGWVEE